MDADDLTVKTVRDGPVSTLILGGSLDLLTAGEFLQRAARVLDDRIERLVLDLAGATFLDCAGVRVLAIATCFAPGGCPVIIRSLSPPARRIIVITVLGTDDIENLRRFTAGLEPRDGLRAGVTSEQELVPVTWRDGQVIRGARLGRRARRRRVPSQETRERLGRTLLAVRAMSPASAARNPTHHER